MSKSPPLLDDEHARAADDGATSEMEQLTVEPEPPQTGDENGRSRQFQRTLLASHGDGVAFGAMVGLGETYLPAFVLAVHLGEVMAGLVASVPLVAGGLMQLVSPLAVRRLKSHKKWVITCATVQALSFVPLVAAAIVGTISAASVLLVATVYWGGGLATGPAWNTWMGSVVPRSLRARFFARRTRLSQAAVLIGLVAAGIALELAGRRGAALTAFAAIFLAAGLFRLLSVVMLSLQHEPVPLPVNMHVASVGDVWRRVRNTEGGRLLTYLVCVQGAVQLSGPYFAPFMLKELNLSYAAYLNLIAASFLTKVILLPTWGHFAQRVGAFRLLWLGGIGIIPLSAMWIVSDHFTWLLLIQIVGGTAWAAYELAFFLLFFESIAEEERTSVLTLYNLANTSAWVAGSTLGALVLTSFGVSREMYFLLFGLSSLGRVAALLLLARVPRSQAAVSPIGVRTVGVRPNTAAVNNPILPSLPDQTGDGVSGRVQ